jgi:outer membrane protein OmpA-like peptidoglycan-associated protein
MQRRFAGTTLAVAIATSFGGCGGPSGSMDRCSYEGWAGTCTLRSVNKVREVEFPQAHVVFEALYSPVQNANNPGHTPPEVREEIKILANQELEFRDYLAKNASVPCQVLPGTGASCSAVRVGVQLPAFTPSGAAVATNENYGCEKLDVAPDGNTPPSSPPPSDVKLPGEFFFEQDSAEINQTLADQATQVANILRDNPAIECLGVVGQTTHGESPSLAAERALSIKNLVLSKGIDGKRLTIFSANVRVYGTGQALPEPDAKERKVNLRVMIHSKPGQK